MSKSLCYFPSLDTIAIHMESHPMTKQISRLSKIGDKIRHKMKSQGHTLESFARQVGMTTSKLGRICTGKGETIDVGAFERIASELKVEFEDLIDTKQPVHPNLTGYPHVDEFLVSFCAELYNGNKGHEVLKDYVTDDYRLLYLHNSLAAPLHMTDRLQASSLAEEMNLNAAEAIRHESSTVAPTQAWPHGKAEVIVHSTAVFKNTVIGKVAENVPRQAQTQYVSTIEIWELNHQWEQIREQILNDKTIRLKVNRRSIGILGVTTNN